MTFNASGIGASRKSGLLQLKTTVRVVAVAALHHSFKHFVMKRLAEIRLHFAVATNAKMRLAVFQKVDS
jgi:hypothetical protein